MALYRRLGSIDDPAEIEPFATELIDRFGSLPDSTENLLRVVRIKQLCRIAFIDQIDAGPKGALVRFRDNFFPASEELVRLISASNGKIRVRPDQKIVVNGEWPLVEARFRGLTTFIEELIHLIPSNENGPEILLH